MYFDINDFTYQGELVVILDDGKVKLVPPTEIADDDKNIETIYQASDTLLRVISSKEESNQMRISALGSHKLDLSKKTQHISRVGWDPNHGFDLDSVDPNLKKFLQKAGVNEKALQEKDTRDFIYDFIDKHGGVEAALRKVPTLQNLNLIQVADGNDKDEGDILDLFNEASSADSDVHEKILEPEAEKGVPVILGLGAKVGVRGVKTHHGSNLLESRENQMVFDKIV